MKIFYTGIGCNKTGEHTVNEFMNIMNREFTHKTWKYELQNTREPHYQLQFKNKVLPANFVSFTLNDWIEYSGASIHGSE